MWLLPSRRRVANLTRFFAAYKATGGTTPGMVLVDVTDYQDNLAAYDAMELPLGWSFYWTHGETQGEKIAEIWDQVVDCSWLGLIGDDCVPETPGWDKRLIDKLDGANFVACDDGWQAPKRVGNCWAISGPLVRAVGYIFPPGLQHLFVDDVWETIGREAGCWRCLYGVMVRHQHVMKGEAPADDTHRAAYGMGFSDDCPGPDRKHGLWANDEAVFKLWLEEERHIAVDAARKLQPECPIPAMGANDPDELGELIAQSAAPAIGPDRATRAKSEADEETRAYLKTRKVMILTPTLYRPAWQYTDAYGFTISALERLGIEWGRSRVLGMSNLPLARNILTAHFLTVPTTDGGHYTDAFMTDDDMDWHPQEAAADRVEDQPERAVRLGGD